MVGANASRDNGSPWLHNMDNTQAQFLRELRLLVSTSSASAQLAGCTTATEGVNRIQDVYRECN